MYAPDRRSTTLGSTPRVSTQPGEGAVTDTVASPKTYMWSIGSGRGYGQVVRHVRRDTVDVALCGSPGASSDPRMRAEALRRGAVDCLGCLRIDPTIVPLGARGQAYRRTHGG